MDGCHINHIRKVVHVMKVYAKGVVVLTAVITVFVFSAERAVAWQMSLARFGGSRLRQTSFLRPCQIKRHKQPQRRPCTTSSSTSSIVMMPEGPECRTLVDQCQSAVGQRLVEWKFLSGRYTRHGKPVGWDAFRRTMTAYDNTTTTTTASSLSPAMAHVTPCRMSLRWPITSMRRC